MSDWGFTPGESRSEWFLIAPQRSRLHIGKWYLACDLPPAIYWRKDYQGHEGYRGYYPGEIIELVERVITDDLLDYCGLLYGRQCQIHVLRRVRLNADDSYTELFQSPLYRRMRAHGELREIPQLSHYLRMQKGDGGDVAGYC